MRKVLIISPHFPPVNAADMHRIRHSLPYFKNFGWEAEVITVDPSCIESYSMDPLLVDTIPSDTPIHYVKAWDVRKTRKFGLGSLSMRSFFHIRRKGNELLGKKRFDLVYFSTTAFHVMALGPYWKKKFHVPFVLDIQDPWRNDFYLDKPKNQRPKKFLIAYNIDKFLEARTIPYADGIISVSSAYCDTFRLRYPNMLCRDCAVIPFSGAGNDFEVMEKNIKTAESVTLSPDRINLVYIGRGGHDMNYAVEHFFKAIKKGLAENAGIFGKLQCWFIGTSYAPKGQGIKTIEPVAVSMGLGDYVREITDRIPYFETLYLMRKADILFVPGSTDQGYTASKIYPYILASKPLLALFHEKSSVVRILKETNAGRVISFSGEKNEEKWLVDQIFNVLTDLVQHFNQPVIFDEKAFAPYSAEEMTRKQVDYFGKVISLSKLNNEKAGTN